jgi:hypothetical protein
MTKLDRMFCLDIDSIGEKQLPLDMPKRILVANRLSAKTLEMVESLTKLPDTSRAAAGSTVNLIDWSRRCA